MKYKRVKLQAIGEDVNFNDLVEELSIYLKSFGAKKIKWNKGERQKGIKFAIVHAPESSINLRVGNRITGNIDNVYNYVEHNVNLLNAYQSICETVLNALGAMKVSPYDFKVESGVSNNKILIHATWEIVSDTDIFEIEVFVGYGANDAEVIVQIV